MIVVEGTFRVLDAARALPYMTQMIKASRAEAGCIDYAYAFDVLDATLVRVHERWTSRAALEAHLATSHIQGWRASWAEVGISDRSLRFYEAEPETF